MEFWREARLSLMSKFFQRLERFQVSENDGIMQKYAWFVLSCFLLVTPLLHEQQ